MKVVFDKKGQPRIEFDEKEALSRKDLQDARAVSRVLNSDGWKVLMKYLELCRESVIDKAKSALSEEDKNKCRLAVAVLAGFDEFRSFPAKVVDRAEKFMQENKEVDYGNSDE